MVKFGIGQAITRREDDRLLTGQARFVDDLRVPGALHAMFVRSPYAHARILSIDSEEARAIEGVVAILTGADLQADGVAPFPSNPMLKPAPGKPPTTAPFHVLAVDAVRFVGQPVVVVLAESRAAAERAANLVTVDCEPLPAVATLAAALAAGGTSRVARCTGQCRGVRELRRPRRLRSRLRRREARHAHRGRQPAAVAGHARTARLRGGVRCDRRAGSPSTRPRRTRPASRARWRRC